MPCDVRWTPVRLEEGSCWLAVRRRKQDKEHTAVQAGFSPAGCDPWVFMREELQSRLSV